MEENKQVIGEDAAYEAQWMTEAEEQEHVEDITSRLFRAYMALPEPPDNAATFALKREEWLNAAEITCDCSSFLDHIGDAMNEHTLDELHYPMQKIVAEYLMALGAREDNRKALKHARAYESQVEMNRACAALGTLLMPLICDYLGRIEP